MSGFSKLSFIFHLGCYKIPNMNSETNPPSPLSTLFASIWHSFLTQASVLLLCQYPASSSRVEGPELFLQSEQFQSFKNFFQELHFSEIWTYVLMDCFKFLTLIFKLLIFKIFLNFKDFQIVQ